MTARWGYASGMASTHSAGLYELPPEFVEFRDTIRQIVRERVAPRAAEIDAKAEYPWDLRRLFSEQDLLGLPFDEEFGGTGTGALMLNVAIEEVAVRFFLEGQPEAAIAEGLGMPAATVSGHVRRARSALREELARMRP